MNDNRNEYALVIAIIVLLLLLGRFLFKQPAQVIEHNNGGVTVETQQVTYNVPPLTLGHGGAWDWMQTTDIACGCDVGLWKEPIVIEQVGTVIEAYPVYQYITGNTSQIQAPIYDFPVFTPPPPPVWWFDWAYQTNGVPGQLLRNENNDWFRLGKYGTFNFNTHRYTEYTKSGDNLYYNGTRFVHDPSRDRFPPSLNLGYASGGGLTFG